MQLMQDVILKVNDREIPFGRLDNKVEIEYYRNGILHGSAPAARERKVSGFASEVGIWKARWP